jgi:hypothetical protein
MAETLDGETRNFAIAIAEYAGIVVLSDFKNVTCKKRHIEEENGLTNIVFRY